MKQTIEGEIFHRIEKMGGREYEHIGFEDKEKNFGNMLEKFVPEIGMRKKARLTIEIIDDKEEQA